AVDAADEFDIVRAPRRIVAHGAHIFLDRLYRRRVPPAQWQVDDARGNGEILQIAQRFLGQPQGGERPALFQHLAIEMQLERADAGHDVDHTGHRHFLQLHHQRVNADAQFYVQYNGAILDQYVAVALLAVDHARSGALRRYLGEDGRKVGDVAGPT